MLPETFLPINYTHQYREIKLQKLLAHWLGFLRNTLAKFRTFSAPLSNFRTFQVVKNPNSNFRTFQDQWKPCFQDCIHALGFRNLGRCIQLSNRITAVVALTFLPSPKLVWLLTIYWFKFSTCGTLWVQHCQQEWRWYDHSSIS